MQRRTFLAGSAAITSSAVSLTFKNSLAQAGIRAVAFDAFAIFDPRSIAVACERMIGARGKELMNAWRARQFEYQWLRALGGHYQDFWQCTAAALDYSCESLGIDSSVEQREALMQEYLRLGVWPDVPANLEQLKKRGLQLALLSNATAAILEAGLARAGIGELFDHVISSDRVRSFKPDPRAYQLGVDVTGLRREAILFVAFAGWDVAGAKWFGYRTFWNNRLGSVSEGLGATADASGSTLAGVAALLEG